VDVKATDPKGDHRGEHCNCDYLGEHPNRALPRRRAEDVAALRARARRAVPRRESPTYSWCRALVGETRVPAVASIALRTIVAISSGFWFSAKCPASGISTSVT